MYGNNSMRGNAKTLGALMRDEFAPLMAIAFILEWLASWAALPAEMILHRGFGRRYLTVGTVIALLVEFNFLAPVLQPEIGLVMIGKAGAGDVLRVVFSPLLLYFILCLAACGWHLYEIWKTVRSGVHVHTRYSGRPYPFWEKALTRLNRWVTIDEWFVKRWAEPLAVLVVGGVLLFITPGLGLFLCSTGLGLLVKCQLEYNRMLDRVFGVMDEAIEAQFLNGYVGAARKPAASRGFSLPMPPAARQVLQEAFSAPSVEDSINGLTAELKALLQADGIATAATAPVPFAEPVVAPSPATPTNGSAGLNGTTRLNGTSTRDGTGQGTKGCKVRCPNCTHEGKVPSGGEGRPLKCRCGQRFNPW